MKANTLQQFPLNKSIDVKNLSPDQVQVRKNKKSYVYGKKLRCKNCQKVHPIDRFYIRDKTTGRRNTKCSDCIMKDMGILNIGKLRFSAKIFKKGFRACAICKNIKPLTRFTKSVHGSKGINGTCYECAKKLHDEFIALQREKGSEKYSPVERKVLFTMDGIKFYNKKTLAQHVAARYDITFHAARKRIEKGYTMGELRMTEFQARSKRFKNKK